MPYSKGMTTSAGMNTLRLRVNPKRVNSKNPGNRRSAPRAKPIYQSGCDPAVAGDGSYGPYIQIGLIVAKAEIRVVIPKTMNRKPPDLAR